MERKPLGFSSEATRKRAKPSTTTQEQFKRRRITRSMQRKTATYLEVEMKENTGTSGTSESSMMATTQELVVTLNPSLNLQRQPIQLACKENIMEQGEGLGQPVHSTTGLLRSRRQQQQQQQLQMYFQPVVDSSEYLSEEPLVVKNPLTSDLRGHHQGRFLSSSHAQVRTRSQLRISQSMTCDTPPDAANSSPLPPLQWVRPASLWRTMRSKDVSKVAPEAELRLSHPEILSSMRIILLDWMMEVCEEYRLHRETYYLAMDMFDRFMDAQSNAQKEQLQLLGVTCLFIASKIEEIYPPKAADFAYVTDGACSVADLLETELIICKVLNWRLNHGTVTVNTWVNTYMQLCSHHFRPAGAKAKEFEFPAYSSVEFPKVMRLLDLCSLDIASRQFGSSVLAAAAVYHQSERCRLHLAMITGFELQDIQMCVNWMHPFAVILSQKPALTKKNLPGVTPQDKHNIQTHEVSITMLEDSFELRRTQETTPTQYALLQDCSVMMTPPRSSERRCLAPINLPC